MNSICPVIIMTRANITNFVVQFKIIFMNEHEDKKMMMMVFGTWLEMVNSYKGRINEHTSLELLEKAFVDKETDIKERGIELKNVIYFEAMFPDYWGMKEFLELLDSAKN